VLINAGQANAATGALGMEDTLESAQKVASVLGLDDLNDVLIESTGVIGKRIKMPELMRAVPLLAANLSSSADAAAAAATAICTTDLARKSVAVSVPLPDGRVVKVGGMGKGSGMIHPNMATMLGVVTCDAPVEVNAWRAMTKRACQNSYNQISVDGDTSTNDTVIALARARRAAILSKQARSALWRWKRRSPPCTSPSPRASPGTARALRFCSSATYAAR
jgi:glutamate N-acetyltransferase/amino-acid N-acetyltransferase